MKTRKKILLYALAAILMFSLSALRIDIPVSATSPVPEAEALTRAVELYEMLSGSELEIPEELLDEGFQDTMVKSVMLGYINFEDTEESVHDTSIRKQDFMSILYKTVINYNDSYTIYEDEADAILNKCYNNAYIDDANKTAYAFMMKHGIASSDFGTKPDDVLSREECEMLINNVYDAFARNITITVGDNDITVGDNVSVVLDTLGFPNRIDETEYGFEWYVYNSDYETFCMVGVDAGRVCAVFSNCASFDFNGISSGDDFAQTADYIDNQCFRFYMAPDGSVDSIMYNPRSRGLNDSASIKRSKSMIVLDLINANRVKRGRHIYVENSDMSVDTWLSTLTSMSDRSFSGDVTTQSGYDVFSVYRQLLEADSEVLAQDTEYITPVGLNSVTDMSGGVRTSIMTDTEAEAELPEESFVEIIPDDYSLNEVEEVTVPVIIYPHAANDYDEGDDIVIELEEQVSTKYHIEMFDVENDAYAVNEYITTDDTKITLPSELFVAGRDYRLILSSITPDGEALSADEMIISYGSAYDTGVEITAPYNNGILDGDVLEIEWTSDKYHDFYVDLYKDEEGLIASKVVENSNHAVINGVAPGKYYLYVTALRRGTEVEKAQAVAAFEAKQPDPVINEIILDIDDTYYFVYEDEELGLLYFYDEEIIEVEENGKTVKKKKILQKQVKSTIGYRQLARHRSMPVSTTGDTTVTQHYSTLRYDETMGGAIVREAEKYLGVPYVWGGTSPNGFDCSGLVQYVCNSLGISVNRVAEDQFLNGVGVNRDELQPGDLIFFENGGYIHHVGIYAGDGMMIHAPHTGEVVKYQSIETDYYRREYAGARRVY